MKKNETTTETPTKTTRKARSAAKRDLTLKVQSRLRAGLAGEGR